MVQGPEGRYLVFQRALLVGVSCPGAFSICKARAKWKNPGRKRIQVFGARIGIFRTTTNLSRFWNTCKDRASKKWSLNLLFLEIAVPRQICHGLAD